MDIKGAKTLLTGASGGLGEAIALALHNAGASLVITGRRKDQLQKIADRTGAQVIVCDLAEAGATERLADIAGAVSILVANAALPASGLLSDYTPEQVDRAIDVNLRSPIHLTQLLLPAMTAAQRGQLVYISSLSGISASPRSSLYSATKFGLRGFALGMRQDLAAQGVGVSLVLPGFVSDAGMFADAGATLPPGIGTVTPERVAAAVVGAIRSDRGEVLVAPPHLSLGAKLSGMFPGIGALAQKSGVSLADNISAGQRSKR